MQINTARFGVIEIAEDTFIHFPFGLLGFETLHRFVLIDSDDSAPMRWLQCVDDPSLAFLLVEPTMFFPEYAFKLQQDDYEMLGLVEGGDIAVACLVVIPADPQLMTVNLMGPLVLNPERRVGKQVVLHDGGYSTRQRLIPDIANSESPVLV